MKAIYEAISITILTLLILLTGCSNKDSDTYFVHAIGFDIEEDDEIKVTALLEKMGDDSEKYFTCTVGADKISSSVNKISGSYKNCYFATADLYFFSSDMDSGALKKIATELCDSNLLPSKADIFCIKNSSAASFLGEIKDNNSLKRIKKASKSKTNSIAFFAAYFSEKPAICGYFSLDNNVYRYTSKCVFMKGGKAVFDDK